MTQELPWGYTNQWLVRAVFLCVYDSEWAAETPSEPGRKGNTHMLKRVFALLAVTMFVIVATIGCGGGGGNNPGLSALITKVMGMAGGMLSWGAHVTVTVDPGTVAEDTLFSISLPPDPLPPAPAGKAVVADTAYDLGPSGVPFAKPVHVSFGYTVTPLLPPQNSLALYKATGGAWVAVPGSTVDTAAHRVNADLNTFSTYAILGDAATFSATADGSVFEVGTATATQLLAADIITIQVSSTGIDPSQIAMSITTPTVGTTPIGPNFAATFVDSTGARDQAIAGSITITAKSATSIQGTASFNGLTHNVTGIAFKLPVTTGP